MVPNLQLFVVTCMDPRVDPAHFLGVQLGDAIVVRNVGGRVTPEVINDLAFISQIFENVLPDGPLFELAVIHHTQCADAISPRIAVSGHVYDSSPALCRRSSRPAPGQTKAPNNPSER